MNDSWSPYQRSKITINVDPDAVAIVTTLPTGDLQVPVRPPRLTIGKKRGNDLCLSSDPTVSRKHCVIHVEGKGLKVEDLESRNGTFLNGKLIDKVADLPFESTITVGKTRLLVTPPDAEYDTTSIIEETFSTKGSIVIPDTRFFQEKTQAYLVVDMADSTSFLLSAGDSSFAKHIAALGIAIEKFGGREGINYLQCTGDGYFCCFPKADNAFAVTRKLVKTSPRFLPSMISLSAALHWGPAQLRKDGKYLGKNIHAVFGLEKLRTEVAELGDIIKESGYLTLLTEPFYAVLNTENRENCRYFGYHQVKGLEVGVGVYLATESRSE